MGEVEGRFVGMTAGVGGVVGEKVGGDDGYLLGIVVVGI